MATNSDYSYSYFMLSNNVFTRITLRIKLIWIIKLKSKVNIRMLGEQ